MIETKFQDSFSREIWETTYMDHTDVDVNSNLKRVATSVASVELTDELRTLWAARFYDLLTNFKGVPGGRILSNAGTEWAGTTLMNCFVGPRESYDIDSIEGIYSHLLSQSQTLKSEGGWGENFSYIRPRGSFIHGIGVETPGAVKYMEIFDKASEIITAGSGKKSANKKAKGKIRKGAMMGVIDVWHPDIVEFITAKQQAGRLTKFNISVNCTDEFMSRVNEISKLETSVNDGTILAVDAAVGIAALDTWDLIFPDTTHAEYKSVWNGDIKLWVSKNLPVKIHNTVSVKWLWNLIMESTYNRAEPGVLFLDRANYFNPLNYGETIFATNPSMPAFTKVATDSGIFDIQVLENKEFLVKSLDGSWAPAKCFKSGEDKELVKISFGSQGIQYTRSTKEHKWPIYNAKTHSIDRVLACDLKVGDLIPLNLNQKLEFSGNDYTEEEGFFVGYFIGDGWFSARSDGTGYSCGLVFGKDEFPEATRILNFINDRKSNKSSVTQDKNGHYYIQFTDTAFIEEYLMARYGLISGEKKIPDNVWASNNDYITGLIDGLLSSDGSVGKEKIVYKSSRKDLAVGFAKLLSFYGVKSNIYETHTTGASFPNGETYDKTYHCWAVEMTGGAVNKFINVLKISHTLKKDRLVRHEFSKNSILRDYIKINKIEIDTVREDVWDISVNHTQHVFPTEWSYTGNCGEQTLSPGNICCLGSINLTQFVKDGRLDFDSITMYVRYMVRFLDNVNSYSTAPLPQYSESMEKKRRIGLGIMGWGSALFMMKTRFASVDASVMREELMSRVARTAYEASIDLAIEKGKFEFCDPIKHAEAAFIKQLGLSDEYMNKLRTTGIRNSSLMSQQPNGNTSIVANVVSGGIEPIFMPEYVRTVIVPHVPADMIDNTPKWYEGEWAETALFKFTNEGDEQILKGEFNGTTYKIDKNRGLTKEVICEDYGVRYLKSIGEWDATAPWAVTTTNLTVDDHVSDLEGFARWTDSACSKTCNIPFDYPYESFKGLYLKVYNTGFIKGFTTYRSGTMTSVLSAKNEKDATQDDEEIILDHVKLPDSSPASMKTLKAEGRKWHLTVVFNEQKTRPFALFVHTNHHEKSVTTSGAVERLVDLATRKGIPKLHIDATLAKISGNDNASKIARVISLNLRHGVLIKNIVNVLDSIEDVYIGSFLFQIKKYLSSFIKDGEKVEGEKCAECGSPNVIYEEGCKKCVNCGSGRCS